MPVVRVFIDGHGRCRDRLVRRVWRHAAHHFTHSGGRRAHHQRESDDQGMRDTHPASI